MGLALKTKGQLRLQASRIPADDKGRNDRLIEARLDTEKVDERRSVDHGLLKPAILCCLGVRAHERVLDNFVAGINLLVCLALIVIPHLGTLLRKYCTDQREAHKQI